MSASEDAPGDGISSGQLQLIGQFQLAALQRRIDHAQKAIALRKVGTALDVSVKTGVRYAVVEAQHAWHVKRKQVVDAAKPRDERNAPVVMLSLQDILKDAEQLDNSAAAAASGAPADAAGSSSRGSSAVAAGAGAGVGAGTGAGTGASQPKPADTEEARDAARRAHLLMPRVMRSPHRPYIPQTTRATHEARDTTPRHANDRHAARLAGVAERAVASLNKYESISMYRYANRIAFDPVRCLPAEAASGSRSGHDHSRPMSATSNAAMSEGSGRSRSRSPGGEGGGGGGEGSMYGKPWFPELRRNMRSLLKLTAARIVIHFPIAAFDERWFTERTANIVTLAFWHTHVRFFAEREWQRSTMLAAKVKRLALAGASAEAAAGGSSAATSGAGEAVGLTLEEEEAAHMSSTLSPSRGTLEALSVIGDHLGVAYVALMRATLSEHLAEDTYEDDPPVVTGDRDGVRTPPKTAGTASSRASASRGSEAKAVSPAPVPVAAAKHTTKMEARVTGRANARKSRAFLDVLPWAVADAVYHAYYFLLAGNRGGYGASFRLQIFLAVGQLLSSVELAPITVMNAIGRHFPRDPLALLHQEFSAGDEAQAGLTVAHAVELANGGKSDHMAKALPARTPADVASLLGGPNFDSNMRVSSSDGGDSPTKEMDAEAKEEEEEVLDRVLSDSRVAHLATTLGYRTPFALFQSTSKADRALLGLGEASRVEVSRKLHRSVALPVSAYLMAGASVAPPLLHASASIAALLRVPPAGHPSLRAHVTERSGTDSGLHATGREGQAAHVHHLDALSSAPTLEDPQLHKFLVHSYQWAGLAMAGVEESADEATEARRKMILENAAREIAERNARRDAAAMHTSASHAFGGSIHDVGPKWLHPWERAHAVVSPEASRAALAKAKLALEATVIPPAAAPSPSRPVSAASAASGTRGHARSRRKASVVEATEKKHEMIRQASSRLLMSQWEQGQSAFARSVQSSLAQKRQAAAAAYSGPLHAAADEGDEWGLNVDDEDEEEEEVEEEEEEDGHDQEDAERLENEGWEAAASPAQPSPARSRLAQALAHADSSRNASGAAQALGGSSIYSSHPRPAQSVEDSHYLDYEGVVDDEGEFDDSYSGVSHAQLPVLHSSGGLAGFVTDGDGLVSVTSVMPRGGLGASDADLAARMLTVRAKHSPLVVPFVMTTASRLLTSVVPEAKVGMRPVRAARRSMPVSWASAGGIDTTRALYKAEKAEAVLQANHATTLRIAAEARAARELSHRTEMEARTDAARLREKVLAGGPQTIAREAWRVRTERARAVAVKMAEAERQRDDHKAYGRSSGCAGGAAAEAAGGNPQARGGPTRIVNPADPGHSGAVAIPGDATITHSVPGVAKGSLPPIALSLVQLGALAASTQGISGRHAFDVDMVALKAATEEDKATRRAHAVLAARAAAVEEKKMDEVRRQDRRANGLV